MPPVRKPRQRTKASESTAPETQETSQSEAPSGFSGSASQAADSSGRKINPRNEPLRVKVENTYKAAGLAIQPLGRWWPILGPLGQAIRYYSDDASYAWVTLAEDDPKYMKWMNSMTSYSAIGEVIGVHIAMGLQSLPQAQLAMQQVAQQQAQQQQQQSSSYQEMMAKAEQVRQANQTPVNVPGRDTSTGGPGDTIRVPPAPTYSPNAVPNDPAMVPTTNAVPVGTPKRAAIPTPAQMNVVIPGEQGGHPFSAAPPPNGTIQPG